MKFHRTPWKNPLLAPSGKNPSDAHATLQTAYTMITIDDGEIKKLRKTSNTIHER